MSEIKTSNKWVRGPPMEIERMKKQRRSWLRARDSNLQFTRERCVKCCKFADCGLVRAGFRDLCREEASASPPCCQHCIPERDCDEKKCSRSPDQIKECMYTYSHKEEASASSPAPTSFCTGASCSTCTQDDCNKAATLAKSHDFEWEAHMDLLLAPVPPEASKEEITFSSYENKKPGSTASAIEKTVTVVKMDSQVFPAKTIFPSGFPVPVMCDEFCDRTKTCKLREQGIADLCKHNGDGKLGKLVHPHHVEVGPAPEHDPWIKNPCSRGLHTRNNGSRFLGYYDPESVRDTLSEGRRVSKWEYRAYKEDPDTPRRIYVGDDSFIRESKLECTAWPETTVGTAATDRSGEVRLPGDKITEGFVPAFIFGPGKPVWRAVTAFDSRNRPYTKLVKYPSIRPIACKVELKDGYVLPVGKASRVLKIRTRADKKRAQAWSAIKRELVPFVGIERASKMASQQVAAMATC